MKKNIVLTALAFVVGLGIAACDKQPAPDGESMHPPAMGATPAAMTPAATAMASGTDKMAPAPMASGMAAPGASGMAMDHGSMAGSAMDHGAMGGGSAMAPGSSMGHGMAAPNSSGGMAH